MRAERKFDGGISGLLNARRTGSSAARDSKANNGNSSGQGQFNAFKRIKLVEILSFVPPQPPTPRPPFLGPSPEYHPSESSGSRSPRCRSQKRSRPQATQGDAVLINFLGGLNHPGLATRAGEEAFPVYDDSEDEVPPLVWQS